MAYILLRIRLPSSVCELVVFVKDRATVKPERVINGGVTNEQCSLYDYI